MGHWRGNSRRVIPRVIAVVALMDAAYRLFMREPLRRSLGIARTA